MNSPSTRLSRRLAALVERFAGYLRVQARRYGLDDVEADEALQDVRIRLWRALERDAASETNEPLPTSYVVKAALSAVRDIARRRRTRRYAAVSFDDLAEESLALDPVDDLDAERLGTHVTEALQTLLPSRRVAVQLHLSGCNKGDIAALLGWSEAKTRNLLYRGLADLRDALRARGIEPGDQTWGESA